jgi:nucleoside-diphosphate-sugar epimerase
MRIFVAGATGVLGRRAVALLVAAGHEVTAVARTDAKASLLRRLGAQPVAVDLFDSAAVKAAVEGHDVVCNLATHIPPTAKAALPGAWSENDHVRTEISRNLVDAALATAASRYIQESITFLYEDGGDAWLDEDSPLILVGHVKSVLAAEGEARRFTEGGGAGVVLRFGLFHGFDSPTTADAVRLARHGVAATLGAADGYLSFITTDDAAAAVVAALAAPAGTYNVVDDEPLTRSQHAIALGEAVGRGHLRLPPAIAAKVGGSKTSLLARSQRVSNDRFREATGWRPAYRSAREAWPMIVEASPSPGAAATGRFARAVRVGLAVAVAAYAPLGAWALLAPRSFYDTFPGGGHHWVSIDGPFNEHLVRDFGALNLAVAFVLLAAALRPSRTLVRVAAGAELIWALPHFLYHAAHLGTFDTGVDAVVNIVSLGGGAVVAVLILAATQSWAREPSAA